jgi:hypothetical protein
MLEDLDDEAIGTMMEDGITLHYARRRRKKGCD